MSQQFNVNFGSQGAGLPQPFQVGGQKQSLQERLVGAAQLRQARLSEARRRLERAQTIDRQDLQALAGYDAGQLADSFRPLFQQDVNEVRNFIMESDDILAQQAKLAELQATWTWMTEHNNETVQAARKAMKGVAFSDPNQQRAASAGLDVGLEFDETPSHFAEVEMQFNNFFDPSQAKKIDGMWMIERDGEFVDIRELEGYGNAEVFTPRTKQVDVGLLSNWATDSNVQRVLTLDGEYSEERAREVFNQAHMNNKTGKEHRAQILATLHQRKESPFLTPAQERAFIEGVPMDKDDEMFASAAAQAFERGEQIFLSMAKSEPTPELKDIARSNFIDSGESTQFNDDDGGTHSGTVRSIDGLGAMVLDDGTGSGVEITPMSLMVDDANQVYIKYVEDTTAKVHTVPLNSELRSTLELRLRTKHNTSISDLLTETKQEGATGLWVESAGVSEDQTEQPVESQAVGQGSVASADQEPVTVAPPAADPSNVSAQDARAFSDVPLSSFSATGEEVPEPPRAQQPALQIGAVTPRLPDDSPLLTKDVGGGQPRTSGVFEAVASYASPSLPYLSYASEESLGTPLNMSKSELVSFFSNPEVNQAIKDLGIEPVSVGQDRPVLGKVLEGAFGWAGYKTAVSKNAQKIVDWMESPAGMEARRKHAMTAAPQQENPIQIRDQRANESSRVIASLPSDMRDRVVQMISNALPQKLFAFETTNSEGEKAIGFLNEAGEDTGEMIFFS